MPEILVMSNSRHNPIAYHPVFTFEEDRAIMESGRVVLGFKVNNAEMETYRHSDYEVLNQKFISALKYLSTGTFFHKMDVYYNVPFKSENPTPGYFHTKIAEYFQDRQQLFHKSYIFLSFNKENKSYNQLPVNNRISALKTDLFGTLKNPIKDIDALIQKAEDQAFIFGGELNNINGIAVERLNTEELQQVYFQYFNQDFSIDSHTANIRTVARTESQLSIGEKELNFISMGGQGRSVGDSAYSNLGVAAPFIWPLTNYLYFPHILHTVIRIEDNEKMLSKLDVKKRLNNQMAFLSSQENAIAIEQIDELTANMRASDRSLTSIKVAVSICEADPKLRQEYVSKVTSAFREMQGTEFRVETMDNLPCFVGFAPGNGSELYNFITMPLENAACHTHWITKYNSELKGDILCDRMRNPVIASFFQENQNGMNGITIGPTGSGKSFTMGYLFAQRKERGAKQIVIDNGGTYKNICETLGGLYMEYSIEYPLKFNPFNIERNSKGVFDLAASDKLSYLVSLLTLLYCGKNPLPDQNRTGALETLVTRYYSGLEPDENPSLKHFADYVEEYIEYSETATELSREELRSIRQMAKAIDLDLFHQSIRLYVNEDVYGSIFYDGVDEDISGHDLVCFDLAKIKNNKTLEPIIGLLITQLSLDQISRYPNAEKYIYIDEAWSMLNGLDTFIESMYRTSRKMKGSITIITQGIHEIVSSRIAHAILTNSVNHIILNHAGNEASFADMQTHLGYTDHMIDMIKSLGVDVNKKWREIFTVRNGKPKVFLVEAGPHLTVALSSTASVRNKLNALQKDRGGNMTAAINQMVESFEDKL